MTAFKNFNFCIMLNFSGKKDFKLKFELFSTNL